VLVCIPTRVSCSIMLCYSTAFAPLKAPCHNNGTPPQPHKADNTQPSPRRPSPTRRKPPPGLSHIQHPSCDRRSRRLKPRSLRPPKAALPLQLRRTTDKADEVLDERTASVGFIDIGWSNTSRPAAGQGAATSIMLCDRVHWNGRLRTEL
jgi:hypothetical protein